jgi:hypothetical protein
LAAGETRGSVSDFAAVETGHQQVGSRIIVS